MTQVIKGDGSREDFDADKLRMSIEASANEADISEERAGEVVDLVANMAIEMAESEDEIESSALREKIHNELDAVEPAVSEAWRKFDEIKAAR
ncbi:MAG: ATP cone domain-containing protein [archaeon]|nr:ATP cone domain-containing protein [archaeon]